MYPTVTIMDPSVDLFDRYIKMNFREASEVVCCPRVW